MSSIVNSYWYKYPCTDYDVLLFLNATGITDQTIASALCALVAGMKANGTWAKCNAIYPFVGATATTHKYNLKNPLDTNAAFRLSFVGGWTHSQSGALPNGTNAYADTFLNTTTNLSLNSHSFGIYSRTNNTIELKLYGNYQVSNASFLHHNLTGAGANFNSGTVANGIIYTANPSTGFLMASRTSNTLFQAYRSGVSLGTNTTAVSTLPNLVFYLGARNASGTAQTFSNHELAFAFLGSGLSPTESIDLSSLVQQFQIALGRQIAFPYVSDTDAQAFVNAANITSVTQANAINTLVVDLKANGIWSKLNAIYPMVGGTAFAHKFNLKDPRDLDAAFRLSFVGGLTHNSNGVAFGGVNGYADTFLTPSTTLTANNNSLSYYSRTIAASTATFAIDMGATPNQSVPPSAYLLTVRRPSNSSSFSANTSTTFFFAETTVTDGSGLFLGSIINSSSRKHYRNGNTIASNLSTGIQSLPPQKIYIGAISNNNVASLFSNRQCAFASIGTGLTDTEAVIFYNIVQAFQTSLGRSIGTQTVSDSDAQAFINAAALTDQVQTTAINNLVLNLKANGLWTRMSAIYPFVGETATTQKFNLKDPRDLNVAFRLLFSGGVTHASTGVTFNGTNGYADTFLTPSTTLTANNNSLSYYSRTLAVGASFAVDIGAFPNQTINSSGYSLIVRRSNNDSAFSANTTSTTSFIALASITDGRGCFIGSIINSSSRKYYRNASLIASNLTTGNQSLPPQKIFIGALSNNNIASLFSNRECAFASIGASMIDEEALAFYNIVQTYQMELGRFVGFPVTLDQDANIFITAAGITNLTQISAINTLVTNLKIAQLWPKMKAIYPMVGGTALAHKFNLKNPVDTNAAYRLLFSGGWTHSATGALPNGTNAYAETYIPVNSLTQNSTHISYYSRSNTPSPITGTKYQYEIGANYLSISPPYYFGLILLRLGITSALINQRTFTTTTTIADTRGYYVGNRISPTQFTMFKNAQLVLTSLDASASPALSPLTIWLAANNGQPGNWSDRECAFATIGDGLTDEEQSNLYTIIQYFQITLSRQV
jgi:hypothetical protein